MMRGLGYCMVLVGALGCAWGFHAAAANAQPHAFFAMDTGTKDDAHQTAEAQAAMLAELGYAGIGYSGVEGLREMLAALDTHGLRLYTVYLTLDIDAAEPNPEIAQAIAALQGRDAILWLTVVSQVYAPSAPEGDAQAVALIAPLAEEAARAGLRIALYPHVNTWLEKVADAVRVADAVANDRVGVTFNLYHWLREGKPDTLGQTLDAALPRLFVVTINGSNRQGSIETLNRGDYDVLGLLQALRKREYAGPIGLQGYGIGGDARMNLALSMTAWRQLTQRLKLDWTALLGTGDFSAFREGTGEWVVAGNVHQHPDDEKRLAWEAGADAVVNGESGKTANLVTLLEHGDIEAHIEFMVPKGSNSGIYFQGRYEIQVLDSWGVAQPQHSDCGGIYQRYHEGPGVADGERGYEGRPPRVNASKAPGEWQSFDVLFRSPRFDASGAKTANAAFPRVLHNGVLVHVNQELSGPTRAALFGDEQPLGPIMLQGDHGPVAYRNLRIRAVDTGPYADIVGYDYGQNRAALLALERDIQSAIPERFAEIEARLLATFAAPDATPASRQFVCRMLQRVGSDATVLTLAPLLGDIQLAHMARFAFDGIPGRLVEETLVAALADATGDLRIGIINTLGDRGRDDGVDALGALLEDNDIETVKAAAAALGKISSEHAFSALLRATPDGAPEREEALARALLACADAMLERGDAEKAAGVYEALYAAEQSAILHARTFRGLALAKGATALPMVTEALTGEEAAIYAAALDVVRVMQGDGVTGALTDALPSLPPDRKADLLVAIADRGDAAALPAVIAALGEDDGTVRLAAIEAAGRLGDATAADALLDIAAAAKGREKVAADTALARLRGEGVDDALIARLAEGTPELGRGCIEALEKRGAVEATPALVEAMRDADPKVRVAAVRALGAVAPPETLPELAAFMAATKDDSERDAAETAIAAVAMRVEAPPERAAALMAALPTPDFTPSLARVLGRLGDGPSLAKLREMLSAPVPETRDAVVRALAAWLDPEALPDLLALAGDAQDETHRILALRGAIRLLDAPADRAVEDTVVLCAKALELATRPDERKMALGVIGKVPHPDAIALAVARLDDPEIATEAAQAILQLAEPLAAANADAVHAALERIIDVLPGQDPATQAQTLLEKLTEQQP